MIDIVEIKKAVKKGEIRFYMWNGEIYCFDNKSMESVKVGEIKI